MKCNECDHKVELIPYVDNEKMSVPIMGNSSTTYSKYRHAVPHKDCSCSLYNMTDEQVH